MGSPVHYSWLHLRRLAQTSLATRINYYQRKFLPISVREEPLLHLPVSLLAVSGAQTEVKDKDTVNVNRAAPL